MLLDELLQTNADFMVSLYKGTLQSCKIQSPSSTDSSISTYSKSLYNNGQKRRGDSMWLLYEGCLGNQTEGVSTETTAGRGADTEERSGKVKTRRTSHFPAVVNQKNSIFKSVFEAVC